VSEFVDCVNVCRVQQLSILSGYAADAKEIAHVDPFEYKRFIQPNSRSDLLTPGAGGPGFQELIGRIDTTTAEDLSVLRADSLDLLNLLIRHLNAPRIFQCVASVGLDGSRDNPDWHFVTKVCS
jgi:hypothetical protein